MRQLIGRDTDAGVLHDQRRPLRRRANADTHAAAGRRELHGVVEEDHDHLPEERRIALHRRLVELLDFDGHALGQRDDARRAGGIQRQIVQVDALARDRPLSGVGARQD